MKRQGLKPYQRVALAGLFNNRVRVRPVIRAVDPPSRTIMLGAFVRALGEALEARSRNAGGDYSPDPNAQRFPAMEAPRGDAVPVRRIGPKVTMTGLVADWWKEAEATGLSPALI